MRKPNSPTRYSPPTTSSEPSAALTSAGDRPGLGLLPARRRGRRSLFRCGGNVGRRRVAVHRRRTLVGVRRGGCVVRRRVGRQRLVGAAGPAGGRLVGRRRRSGGVGRVTRRRPVGAVRDVIGEGCRCWMGLRRSDGGDASVGRLHAVARVTVAATRRVRGIRSGHVSRPFCCHWPSFGLRSRPHRHGGGIPIVRCDRPQMR